jgi:hypothetical protein
VRITDSPYALTEQRRKSECAEVDDLRRVSEHQQAANQVDGTAPARCSDSEAALARALLTRAGRALETAPDAVPALAARVHDAAALLAQALERLDPEVSQRADALSDALLDLM